MEDNEIVKALEDYIKENEFEYFHSNTMGEYPLIKKSLNLINRLQADNKSQSIMIKMLNGSIEDYKKSYINQKAEIERLTVLADLGNMRANDYRAMRDKCKTAKAEAYKEFAERLKEKYQKEKFRECYTITDEDIDNLLKEMGVNND